LKELPESAVTLAVGNGLRHIRRLRLITFFSAHSGDGRAGIIGRAFGGLVHRGLLQPIRPVPVTDQPLVGVVVLLSQIGLVHVRMRVFSSVGVGVGVVVFHVVVLVAGVRVGVSNFVVVVFVGVRFVVTVLMLCHCHPLWCRNPDRIYCALRIGTLGTIEGILSGPQHSWRVGCRTVRMGLRCQGPGPRGE